MVSNLDNGYHGYWASDLYTVNSHFGTKEDLLNLADALHQRDMYLMIDVVANHMGIPQNYDYSSIKPFDSASHYHSCTDCPSSCNIEQWSNQEEVELCRLAGLPDLNQSVPFVNETLHWWVKEFVVEKYKADGIRIDTVVEVTKPFWCSFQSAAGAYAVGEV